MILWKDKKWYCEKIKSDIVKKWNVIMWKDKKWYYEKWYCETIKSDIVKKWSDIVKR